MKKIFAVAVLSSMLLTSLFSISELEKMLLPIFTGNLSEVTYKIIDSTDDKWVVEIDGVTYVYELKK